MAERLLFKVEDTFLIIGRGLVPVPGIVLEKTDRFKIGDPILLRRPDGSTLEWKIGGIESGCGTSQSNELRILLTGLTKEQVPIGTEIWTADSF